MPESKVCPYCGNDWFVVQRKPTRKVLINPSTGEERVQEIESQSVSTVPVCNYCQREVEAYVTERFFHEVICNPDFEDTAVIIVSQQEAQDMITILKNEMPLEEYDNGDTIESFSGDLLAGEYEVEIKVVNADMPYVDAVLFKNVDGVYKEVAVLEPSEEFLGSYEFEAGGKRFQAIVMTTESDLNDTQCISNVTSGNTEGNEESDEDPKWTIIVPLQADRYIVDRMDDDRQVRDRIADYKRMYHLRDDDIILLPPTNRFDTTEFMRRF